MADAYLPTPKTKKDYVLINLQNGTFEITMDFNLEFKKKKTQNK